MTSFQDFFRDLGLQRKLMLVSVLTTVAALLVALLALASYDVLAARPKLMQDLSVRIGLLAMNLDADLNFGDKSGAGRKLEGLRASKEISRACLFTADKRLFAAYMRASNAACEWPRHLELSGHRFDGDGLSMLSPIRFEREVVGYLAVESQLPSTAERLQQYGLVLAVVLLTLFFRRRPVFRQLAQPGDPAAACPVRRCRPGHARATLRFALAGRQPR